MKTSILSKKGWIVIPGDIRKRYRLEKGDKVNVIDYGGVISIIPVSKDIVEDSAGMLEGKTSLTKALIIEREKDRKLGK
ncbi:MAG: AbrB/MazE/SpoVT family DNA-binding domain-containing protein [Actinobacteria bacterium]|nr:AbrB/MazE/SpoVT family DNA-binding domain-containing protein [Actinomycetota bacterium]